MESKINNLPDEPNLSLRISRFNDILISAAATHVGKSKPSKESKPWMNPHVRVKRICILYTYPYTIGSGYTNKNKFILVKESLKVSIQQLVFYQCLYYYPLTSFWSETFSKCYFRKSFTKNCIVFYRLYNVLVFPY